MLGLYYLYLCFTVLVEHSFAHVILPYVIETAAQNLRSKREASCGGDVDVRGGSEEIKLVTEIFNGTEFYKNNEDCTWTVKTLPDHIMILRSDYFSLEQSDNCIWDYVEITEGGAAGTPSRFCGWDPMKYITVSNEITLRFKSDVSYEDDGFKFVVESKQRDVDVSKCDSSIIGGDDSRIMNNVEVGKGCLYRIQAPGDKVIELNLKMLDFGSAACDDESIVVYKGLSTQGEPLGKICSGTKHGIQPYHVNMLFIEYRNLLQQEGERFTIEYSFVEDVFTPAPVPPTTPSPVGGNNDCSGMYKGIKTDSGDLIYAAPEYENNKECIIVVRNTQLPLHVVQIEFLYFDTEDSDNCMFDSLKIMSGERADSDALGGPYCGVSLHGRTFLTSGNSLRLEFKTDESIALRGFKARISFVPYKDCTCEENQICIRQDHEKKCIRGQQCRVNTCQNGGTCKKTGSTQKCYCPAGFQGNDCSQSDGELSSDMWFTTAPGDRALKRGDSYTEQCAVKVRDEERVEYEWTFNGAEIEAYNRRTGFGSHPGGVLQIDKFTDELEGQYSCFAKTSSGTAEHTFEYRIVEDCDVRIYPGPQTESKRINENALLSCHVDSRAKAVRWKKDGVYINFENNTKFKKLVNNYLQISDVRPSDSGIYRCEAEDNNGCYSYKEGTLTVVDVKPLNKYCGISLHDEYTINSRISKGSEAKPNEHPWHVTLRSSGGSSRHIAFCGGTLISKRYILTAAHCVTQFEENEQIGVPFTSENVVILLGTTNCLLTGDETTRTFKSFIVHPNYGNQAKNDNDIALIELDSPVYYTDSIRPICLEKADYNDRVFFEKRTSKLPVPSKATGCGMTKESGGFVEKLQVVHIPYVYREECEESLGDHKDNFNDRMFCAGSKIAKGGDTCSGDSGGGLVMSTETRWVQTGIVSWGLGCDVDMHYGIYTDVGRFYDWIEGVTHFSEEEMSNFLTL
ncbi:mannan-binding lectin serine protease 1-like [Mercenaria mercenaria]|uniref:mannan-binding lectin serine protease 1-like n=1 Tax=Mercenaria mercenaria TaxID=6596 RepID=UPI00234E467F|nr:mannan-binding lectin serine protease 1-like [Mercenaria mercenaria]